MAQAKNQLTARLMHAVKTAEDWLNTGTVPYKGELCFESDTLLFKLGNGINQYKDLPYCTALGYRIIRVNDTNAVDIVADTTQRVQFLSNSSYITLTPDSTNKTITVGTTGLGDIVTHNWSEVSTAITNAINALDSSVAADSKYVLTGVTETNGKLTGKTQVAYTTIAPIQDVVSGSDINVTKTNNVATVNHATITKESDGNAGTLTHGSSTVITDINVSSTGHVTKITKGTLPSNPSNLVTGSGLTADTIVLGNGNSTVKTSGKKITTSVSSGGTDVPTSGAVYTAIQDALSSAMQYKGTVAKFADLPTSPKTGDVYVVSTNFEHSPSGTSTLTAGKYEAGDMFIWNGLTWDAINGENQVTVQSTEMTFGGERNIGMVDGTQLKVTMPTINPSIGTPSTLKTVTKASQNTSTSAITLEFGDIQTANTTQKGVIQLSDSVANNSTYALTPKAVYNALAALKLDSVSGVITSISQNNGKVSATADTVNNVAYTTLNNGGTGINLIVASKNKTNNGLAITGGTDKFTVSDGTNSFDVAISHSNPASYGQVTVSKQSTATTNSAGATTNVTVSAVGANEALKLTSANKWVNISGTNSATAGADEIKISHLVGTIGSGGSFYKFSYDTAGHITAVQSVASTDIGSLLTDLKITLASAGSTSNTANNANLTTSVTAFGKTSSASIARTTTGLHTSLLMDDSNVELIIDGNFS